MSSLLSRVCLSLLSVSGNAKYPSKVRDNEKMYQMLVNFSKKMIPGKYTVKYSVFFLSPSNSIFPLISWYNAVFFIDLRDIQDSEQEQLTSFLNIFPSLFYHLSLRSLVFMSARFSYAMPLIHLPCHLHDCSSSSVTSSKSKNSHVCHQWSSHIHLSFGGRLLFFSKIWTLSTTANQCLQ